MLDYPALAALAAVVREGSFDGAARALHVTPSAVSQRIRQLEERVGCALVVREHPCRATDMGRRLCQHVDRVRLLEQDLQGALPALAPGGADAGDAASAIHLPIAVNADSLATWLTPALARFASNHHVLLDVSVDDQDHTGTALRSGAVLAAVTAAARPAAGCNSQALGAMRYVAAASPAFVERWFAHGVGAASLARAPSLVFDRKDALQARWAQRHCRRHVELPRHTLPSTAAFVTAALAGMGWGLQPLALVEAHVRAGRLVPLVADAPYDVQLFWHSTRAASSLLAGLSSAIVNAAKGALLPA